MKRGGWNYHEKVLILKQSQNFCERLLNAFEKLRPCLIVFNVSLKTEVHQFEICFCTLSFQERPAPADISVLSLFVHRSLVDLTELHLEENNSLNCSKSLWVMMSRKHFVYIKLKIGTTSI